MRSTIGILSLLLLVWTCVQAKTSTSTETSSTTHSETIEYGPIVMVVDRLADMAVDVSDDTTKQLQANMEHLLSETTNNLAELSANAMAELRLAMEDTNQLIMANPSCNAGWNLEQLMSNVSQELSACTAQLEQTVDVDRYDAEQALEKVGNLVQQMALLPAQCQNQLMDSALQTLGMSSGDNDSCFTQGMASINQGLALAMHNASLLLVRMRQATQEQLAQAQECSAALVSQVTQYLNAQRADCN